MQVVVNISEEEYKMMKKLLEYGMANPAMQKICNGTILPKGHGRLIDENELKKELIRRECSKIMYDTLDHTLSYMKPIIEADKAESEVK